MTALVRAPLCGEILGADASVTVMAALHPLSSARETLQAPAGLSVAEIVELALHREPRGRMGRGLRVWIGTDPIPQERWGAVRPKAGTILMLRAVPRGGAGSLFRAIAMLAVAVLTAFVAPYLTPILGTLGTAIVSAAITVGAGLLINALFPVNATSKDSGQVYSIGGNQNLATRYQPLPVLHGQMRVYPRYGGSAYSEFEGDNQVLRLLYVWGYGPMDVEDMKIGETPIATFHDCTVETFYGYPSDPQPTIYPTTVVQQDLNIEVKQVDGWTTRTTSEDVTEWAIDFGAPNGLSATKTSGEVITLSVSIEVEQSVAYANDWQPVQTLNLSGKSTKPIRMTVRRPVPSGTYDLRWRRTTPDTDGNPKLISNTVATAMRSYRAVQPITFGKPLCVSAIRIRATSQLSGIVDNLNAVCTSRVKTFDGAAWIEDRPSTKPADQLIRALQGPANPRPVADGRIDWETIQEWRAWCIPRGYAYNRLHTETQSVLATAQDIASAGRAAIVFRDGKWSVVWDAPDAPVVQHFTPRNSWGFRGKRTFRRLPHAYRVKFKNQDRGWRDDEITVYADGYDVHNATLFEELEFPGQTDHALNWKHGRYHDAQVRLRPGEYHLSVDIEHLICTRGDRVRVTHDVPGWGVGSARVLGTQADTVYLDDVVTMLAGQDYCVRFRLADGTGVVWRVVTVVGEASQLTLTVDGSSPAVRPAAGDLAMFGKVDQETVVLRVKGITPGEDMSAELLLVADAPEIADADQGTPPDVIDTPTSVNPALQTPRNLRVVEGRTSAASGYHPTVTLLWDTPPNSPLVQRFEVALKAPGDADFGGPSSVDASERSKLWQDLPPGSYSFRVRSLFTDNTWSNPAVITIAIVSWSASPPDVTGLRVDRFQGMALISWDPPSDFVAVTEIRYSPATVGAAWETASAVVSRSNGASASTPFSAGSYLAKFTNGGGVYSQTAAVVVAIGGSAGSPVGEVFDYAPFTGSHDSTVETVAGVRLVQDGTGAVRETGTYQPTEIIALDAVYTVRLSGDVLAQGVDLTSGDPSTPDIYGVDPNAWRVALEISTTLSDPAASGAAWSPWAAVGPSEVTARGIRGRVRLSSLSDGISPMVELVHLRADVDPRLETGSNIAVPAAGIRISYSAPFQTDPALVALRRGGGTSAVLIAEDRDASGFTVRLVDPDNNPLEGNVDFIASGIGRRGSA